MIALPTWLVVMGAIGALWLWRRTLTLGRVQGFRYCLNTIVIVADLYGEGNNRPLEPHEADVAQCLDIALPDLITGYTKQQAAKIEATR